MRMNLSRTKNPILQNLTHSWRNQKISLRQIPEEKRVLVTAHDAFGYFGRAYNIEVVGLQGLSTEDEIGITDIDDTINVSDGV